MPAKIEDDRGRNGARRDRDDQRRHDDDCFPPTGKKGSGQKYEFHNDVLASTKYSGRLETASDLKDNVKLTL